MVAGVLLIVNEPAPCAPLLLAASTTGKITASYVEVRSADVFVGACYANAEGGLVGQEGTMAWNIKGGEYLGVPLKGLSVVAVVLGKTTIGDPHSVNPMRSVLIMDQRASARQREALRSFVHAAAGKMLGDVVREEIAPISFEQAYCEPETGHEEHMGQVPACTKVTAGSIVTLQTRNLRHTDHLCANAERFYPPMITGTQNETAVFAPQMIFRGQGLGTQWSIPDKRGGFVANFELSTGQLTEN
jgi:hypothetical protein